MLISTVYDLLLYGAAVQQGTVTPSVQVPGDLPQTAGGRGAQGGGAEALPYMTHAPRFLAPRRVTKLPPPEEIEPESPPGEDEVFPSAPVEYPFTADDFFKESPTPPPVQKPPRIKRGKCRFVIPVPTLKASPIVVVSGAVQMKPVTAKFGSVEITIPTVTIRASGYRRFKDDAISLAMKRPDLEDALDEWIVG